MDIAAFSFQITGGFLEERGQRAGFLLLAAFLLSFLFIRTSARLIRDPRVTWWPGNVETSGGLHIHHLVWGICLLLASGFLAFAVQPEGVWFDALAILFGIGAGLTLDEFALWLHLEDVYWAEAGRSSIDAVVVAALIAGLVVAGLAPFDVGDADSISAIALAMAIDLALVLLAIAKGRRLLAIAGVFIPVLAVIATVRLAAPDSLWARRRYAADGAKLERARLRTARTRERLRRVADLIAGSPSVGDRDAESD